MELIKARFEQMALDEAAKAGTSTSGKLPQPSRLPRPSVVALEEDAARLEEGEQLVFAPISLSPAARPPAVVVPEAAAAAQPSPAAAASGGGADAGASSPAGVEALALPQPPLSVTGKSGLVYTGWSTGRPHWRPRRWAIYLSESSTFETLALLTILTNCVTMAADYPIDLDGTPKKELLELLDMIFLGIYTFEMAVKMLAFGVHCGEGSYWFNGWAIFEGFIVFVSWTPFLPIPSMPKALQSVLRAFRALRVLRALFIIPGMKALVSSTLQCIPALAAVSSLWALVIWLMSIVGVQLFKGALHPRCALPGFESPPPSRFCVRRWRDGARPWAIGTQTRSSPWTTSAGC